MDQQNCISSPGVNRQLLTKEQLATMCQRDQCCPGCRGWRSSASTMISKRASGVMTKIFSRQKPNIRYQMARKYSPCANLSIVAASKNSFVARAQDETLAEWAIYSWNGNILPIDRRKLLAHLEFEVTYFLATSPNCNYSPFITWPDSLAEYLLTSLPPALLQAQEQLSPEQFKAHIKPDALVMYARPWLSVNERRKLGIEGATMFQRPHAGDSNASNNSKSTTVSK